MAIVKREKGESSRRRKMEAAGGGEDGEEEEEEAEESPAAKVKDDLSDRRLLRSRYRELKSDVNGMKGQLAQADFAQFKGLVERADHLHKQVSKPREQITDAEVLMGITSELWDVAKSAQAKTGMSPAEFVGAVIRSYGVPGGAAPGPPTLDWRALGLDACAVFRHAPGMATMVGPMDVEPRRARAPASRKRDAPAQKTRPSAVKEADAGSPCSETDSNMRTMFEAMIQREEVRLDHLVLNRVSFAQTVENLFALSFLVKDGRAEIKFSESGVQSVVPRNAPSPAERASGKVVNTQFIFRLDFGCWELMRATVPEGAEVIPRRQPADGCAPPETDCSVQTEPELEPESQPQHQPQADRTPVRKFLRNRARETPASWADGEADEEPSRRLRRKLVHDGPSS